MTFFGSEAGRVRLRFADRRLQATAESAVRLDDRFGAADGALLRQRLCELAAADDLSVAASVPTLGLTRLQGVGARFAVSVHSRLRVVVAPDDETALINDGATDLSDVKTVRILAIEECDEP